MLHVLGAALVVGGIAVFDLKVLADDGLDAPAVGRVAIPLAATGVALQLPTGLTLLAVEATKLGINPAFYAKMAFLALGLVNLAAVPRPLRLGHARRVAAAGRAHLRPGLARRLGARPRRRPHDRLSLKAWLGLQATLQAARSKAWRAARQRPLSSRGAMTGDRYATFGPGRR